MDCEKDKKETHCFAVSGIDTTKKRKVAVCLKCGKKEVTEW
jgi:hypothetical protein